MHRAYLAAALNVVPLPLGLGYLYLGRRDRWLWVLAGILAAVGGGVVVGAVIAAMPCAACVETGTRLVPMVIAGAGVALVGVLSGWDAFQTALGRTRQHPSFLGRPEHYDISFE